MKDNKGITLVTLIGYIVLSLLVISALILVTGNFKKNFNELDVQSVQEIQLDKINLQLTKEIKEGKRVDRELTTENTLVFKNGNIYKYVAADKKIYQNDNVTIAEYITSCKFEMINEKTLKVTVGIEGKTRVSEYLMPI